jgi:uncharacterized protein YukE
MGLLDTNVPQMITSQGEFHTQATQFQSTVTQAEGTAMAAQAAHQGESAVAFQSAHARFVEAAQKANTLLMQAGQNIGEGASTYTLADAEGEQAMQSTLGALPTI